MTTIHAKRVDERAIDFHVTCCLHRDRSDDIIQRQVARSHGFRPEVVEYTKKAIAEQRAAKEIGR